MSPVATRGGIFSSLFPSDCSHVSLLPLTSSLLSHEFRNPFVVADVKCLITSFEFSFFLPSGSHCYLHVSLALDSHTPLWFTTLFAVIPSHIRPSLPLTDFHVIFSFSLLVFPHAHLYSYLSIGFTLPVFFTSTSGSSGFVPKHSSFPSLCPSLPLP